MKTRTLELVQHRSGVNGLEYEECQKFAQVTGIKNREDWMNFIETFKDEIPRCIPRNPELFYRRKSHVPIWLDYNEVKKIIRKYNYKSRLEFTTNYKKENFKNLGIPMSPERIYSKQWKGWKDFLGSDITYLSFTELKKLVRQAGLMKYHEFLEWRKTCGIK